MSVKKSRDAEFTDQEFRSVDVVRAQLIGAPLAV